ncbi:MAG: hypothetical protein JSR78_19600 [Proteobacteria bacterium]|nr:hypothetical protein [Pseudomonadota bacterium]
MRSECSGSWRSGSVLGAEAQSLQCALAEPAVVAAALDQSIQVSDSAREITSHRLLEEDFGYFVIAEVEYDTRF